MFQLLLPYACREFHVIVLACLAFVQRDLVPVCNPIIIVVGVWCIMLSYVMSWRYYI